MKTAFALLAAAALSVATPLLAQEGTLKKIKDSGSITIGHRDASIPFSYYDDKQQPVGYAMDDILLYSLVAQARNPGDYHISSEATSVEPYGIMVRKDDATFKKVVDAAMVNLYKSGEINKIYEKWFQKPIPPKGLNLNIPMSPQFKKVVANPTDSGDQKDYQ